MCFNVCLLSRSVAVPGERRGYEYASLSKLTYNILRRLPWEQSRAFSCWRSKLVVSLWTNLCSVLGRVFWICHPLKPTTGFYLLPGQSWCKGTLNNLKQRTLCGSPCAGPASPAGDRRGSQGTCPATAVGNRKFKWLWWTLDFLPSDFLFMISSVTEALMYSFLSYGLKIPFFLELKRGVCV